MSPRVGSHLGPVLYGRKYRGALRATFVIDGSGKVVHVIPRVTPRTHDVDRVEPRWRDPYC